ncbi:uncharacterized protein G2W53_035606 [Senna tora]|uniref:Uncharacterized protein n=1 Tax=Senna tora TaxID=362788 RepID=A0A834W531_9FABA|nr:uncharacterized protein G2W53_035606 [Senna tora]
MATRKMPAKSLPVTPLLVSLLSSSCTTTSSLTIIGVVITTVAASGSVGTFAGSIFQQAYEQHAFTMQYGKMGSRRQPCVSVVSLNRVSLSLGHKDTPSFKAFIVVVATITDSFPVDATTALNSFAKAGITPIHASIEVAKPTSFITKAVPGFVPWMVSLVDCIFQSSIKNRVNASLFPLSAFPAASSDHHPVTNETHQPAMVLGSGE